MDITEWIRLNSGNFQVVLFLGSFAVLIAGEALVPRVARTLPRRSRWPANLVLTALNVVLLGALPVSFISVAEVMDRAGIGLLHVVGIPMGLLLVANLLLRGLISFSTHASMHYLPAFWRVHRVHHLDTELDVSTTVRFHPFEFLIQLGFGLPFVAVGGFTPWMIALYELLDVSVTLVSHANVRLPAWLNRPLRYVLVTPDLHRVHHSARLEETNSNFGAVFPLWDLIFRTFRPEPSHGIEAMRIGLEEVRDRRTNSLLWLLKSPFFRHIGGHPEGAESSGHVTKQLI